MCHPIGSCRASASTLRRNDTGKRLDPGSRSLQAYAYDTREVAGGNHPALRRGHDRLAVTINGQSAGPLHQDGYAFQYDITGLLKPAGQLNEIQVDVDDESSDASVNRTEHRGDFWN